MKTGGRNGIALSEGTILVGPFTNRSIAERYSLQRKSDPLSEGRISERPRARTAEAHSDSLPRFRGVEPPTATRSRIPTGNATPRRHQTGPPVGGVEDPIVVVGFTPDAPEWSRA